MGSGAVAPTNTVNTLNGDVGNDQMIAAAGHSSNRYIFAPGSGQDSITDVTYCCEECGAEVLRSVPRAV